MQLNVSTQKIRLIKQFQSIYKSIHGKIPIGYSLWEKSIEELQYGVYALKLKSKEVTN